MSLFSFEIRDEICKGDSAVKNLPAVQEPQETQV